MKDLRKFIKTTIREFLNENKNKNQDKLIYDLVSDWVISSLDDVEKRQEIGRKLLEINIPTKYKEVPNYVLYRVGKPKNKFVSYTYDIKGIKTLSKWYKKIFNKKITDSDIIEEYVRDVNVLICIPTFLKKTGFSSGKRFDAIWKSEYEVICVNPNVIENDKKITDDVFIDGLYDPEYEENGLVLFSEPKNIKEYNIEVYSSDLVKGVDFKKRFIDFENKKLHKVIFEPKINIGSNLGSGEYWCVTKYCLDVYLGNTPDSSEYSKYVESVIDLNLSNNKTILVKDGISDLL